MLSLRSFRLLSLWLMLALQTVPVWATGPNDQPQVIEVGPTKAIKTIAAAAGYARAGATILVNSGIYFGDVAVWTQDNITVRAVGGRVLLRANGAAAEGKGIWVVRAQGLWVEGFDFEGAKVPDRNGAAFD